MVATDDAGGAKANVSARRFHAVSSIVVLLALSSAACDEDDTLYGAVADSDDSDANVVVKVGQCTGTLISPRVVLTASHCIYGSENPAGPGAQRCVGESAPYVSIGKSWLSPEAVFSSLGSKSKVGGCQVVSRRGEDMAVVYLADAVTQSKRMGAPWNVPRIVRPSLRPPERQNDHFDGIVNFSGFSPWDDGYKTWRFLTRRIQPIINIRIRHENRDGGAYFTFDLPAGNGVRAGDSGGPMFVVRPDGSRDKIGIITQTRGTVCYAVDATWTSNKEWLIDHVTNGGIAAMVERGELSSRFSNTPEWLAAHGKSLDDWWGELDYSGPCDSVRDEDCDGWWDHGDLEHPNHDDCPADADPLQEDYDGDGIGDACEDQMYD